MNTVVQHCPDISLIQDQNISKTCDLLTWTSKKPPSNHQELPSNYKAILWKPLTTTERSDRVLNEQEPLRKYKNLLSSAMLIRAVFKHSASALYCICNALEAFIYHLPSAEE